MKKRTLFIVALLVLLLGSTMGAYAYWDNLQQTETETINIGEGTTLTVSAVAEVPAGKYLVPDGVVLKANDVESIVLTYNVVLDQTALTALNLSVVAENIAIGGSGAGNEGLVNIDISLASATVNDSNVLVTVTVTLDEPASSSVYTDVINEAITFDLKFTASQPA